MKPTRLTPHGISQVMGVNWWSDDRLWEQERMAERWLRELHDQLLSAVGFGCGVVMKGPFGKARSTLRGRFGDVKEVIEMATRALPVSPWLTLEESAAYLKMGEGPVTALFNTGEIESRQRGNKRFSNTVWLDAYMDSLPSGARVPAALRAVS